MMHQHIAVPKILASARRHVREAGRILRLIRFQTHAEAPIFAPGISTYADMMDPDAEDAARLSACRDLLGPVRCRIALEALTMPKRRQSKYDNPYGVELATSATGLLLIYCEAHLRAAIRGLQIALYQMGQQ
ncbi:MAG: hypothetical protein Q4G26_13840 [Paracoccus sp. (in: a-proteobacteria)]|nr:hypothetical protein [Paracoccus sp. (in: a-proteobacteria)]